MLHCIAVPCNGLWYKGALYLDDLSTQLSHIKAGRYIGEVLLNNLMFSDNICVFCPSVLELQKILDVCQAYAKSHGINFNCSEIVCMTYKANSAKNSHPITDTGWLKCKIC